MVFEGQIVRVRDMRGVRVPGAVACEPRTRVPRRRPGCRRERRRRDGSRARTGYVSSGRRRCGCGARCPCEERVPPAARRNHGRSGGGANTGGHITGCAGNGRTGLPFARVVPSDRARRARPTRGFGRGARQSQCDTSGSTCHGANPCSPSSLGRPPRARYPHRHLLCLPSRSSRPRRMEGVTD